MLQNPTKFIETVKVDSLEMWTFRLECLIKKRSNKAASAEAVEGGRTHSFKFYNSSKALR